MLFIAYSFSCNSFDREVWKNSQFAIKTISHSKPILQYIMCYSFYANQGNSLPTEHLFVNPLCTWLLKLLILIASASRRNWSAVAVDMTLSALGLSSGSCCQNHTISSRISTGQGRSCMYVCIHVCIVTELLL